jgi:organizing structure protein 2
MAARLIWRKRFAPAATGAVLAGIALFPKTVLHAESPNESISKKPIYDDLDTFSTSPSKNNPLPDTEQTHTKPKSPTPTDRLALQIGKTRLFIYGYVAAGEDKVNSLMDSVLHLESSFTGTIASLAPAPQTGEKLMPGSLYVLVAAMTGSIISRNRSIFVRATFPLAVGIGAGWIVLPVTMRNVGDLVWKYEQRFPALADGHIKTREGIEKAWRMTRIHTQQAVSIVDEKVTASRGAVEDWVKKGK